MPRVVLQEERPGQFLQVSLEQPVISYNAYLAFYTVFLVKGALGIQSETLLTGSCPLWRTAQHRGTVGH